MYKFSTFKIDYLNFFVDVVVAAVAVVDVVVVVVVGKKVVVEFVVDS